LQRVFNALKSDVIIFRDRITGLFKRSVTVIKEENMLPKPFYACHPEQGLLGTG
jgi:hypothetical protein